MKKLLFFIILFLVMRSVFTQSENIQIDFDNYISENDNDLVNNFIHSSETYYQVQTNGITGGAIAMPNYISWGNEYIRLCKTANVENNSFETSMSFKFNSSILNPNGYHPGISFFLHQEQGNGGNHIQIHLTNDLIIRIQSSLYYHSSEPLPLEDNHWYDFVITYLPIGGQFNDEVSVKLEVLDLGISGIENPINVGVLDIVIFDPSLIDSSYIYMEISGSKSGGVEYLDNFSFQGVFYDNLCEDMSINELYKKVEFYPNPIKNNLHLKNIPNNVNSVEILDLNGKTIHSIKVKPENNSISINLNYLPKGIYFYKIGNQSSKFIKN